MAFSLFRKKKKAPAPPKDPIAAYDGFIEELERQGAQVRRSAATLLALRSELARARERNARRLEDILARQQVAQQRTDAKALATLTRDAQQAEKLLDSSKEALARAEVDAQLLLEGAQELSDEVVELKAERSQARARLAAGQLVTDTLKVRTARIEKVLALDAARDEVERAHALADIYREDQQRKKDPAT